uniref:Uncharacterized protein n=1 Tax=Chaetoceros debilis TaxID=122233 RepID=A0A7S3Q292_9STRA
MPLRQELITLGIETVFNAKGVGWNRVKKNSKKHKRIRKKKDKRKNRFSLMCGYQSLSTEDIHEETTPRNGNLTKDNKSQDFKALTYEEYVKHLEKCHKTKIYKSKENNYLEVEVLEAGYEDERLRRRIFTNEMKALLDEGIDDSMHSIALSTEEDNDNKCDNSQDDEMILQEAIGNACLSPLYNPTQIVYRSITTTDDATAKNEIRSDSPNKWSDAESGIIHKVVDNIMATSVTIEESGVASCPTPSIYTSVDTSFVAPIQGVVQPSKVNMQTERLPAVRKEPIIVNTFRETNIMDSHFMSEHSVIPTKNIALPPKLNEIISSTDNLVTITSDELRDDSIHKQTCHGEIRDDASPRAPTESKENSSENSKRVDILEVLTTEEDKQDGDRKMSPKHSSVNLDVKPAHTKKGSVQLTRKIMKENGFADLIGDSSSDEVPPQLKIDDELVPLKNISEMSTPPGSPVAFTRSPTTKTVGSEATASSFFSESKTSSSVVVRKVETDQITELKYEQVMSFPSSENLSIASSSSFHIEGAKTTSKAHGINNSFSFNTYSSGILSIRSSATELSCEEVEQCVNYTVDELNRINSMLVDAETFSCNSETSDCHDALYFASQSKKEIAALAMALENQIVEERDSTSFDITASAIPYDSGKEYSLHTKDSFLSIGSMRSYDTEVSCSILANPSMDRLIAEVNQLCNQIEDRIDNIVSDSRET